MTVPRPSPLARVRGAFQRWLGDDFDLDAIYAVMAAAAAQRLNGDPCWLLLLSGPGNAKTETVSALAGSGAIITSMIASEGALLSGSSRRDKAKDATGGLLRRIGSDGVLVIKDVTSILSMHRDMRLGVLAALREIHDGRWERNVGTNGGLTLTWQGRITVIGAVTTQWDRAHDVTAAMGDRFVVLRLDSTQHRQASGRRAIANTGDEPKMRAHLSEAVAAVLSRVTASDTIQLTDLELARLVAVADLVTLARTGVDYDYRGDVIDAHAPEMPTRFAKQLTQILRGAVAIGLDRDYALRLALRCARDSMPPIRLEILEDVAAHPESPTVDIRRRLNKPRNTVDRQLQALHLLGVVTCDEIEMVEGRSKWFYSVAAGIDPASLCVPDLSVHILGNSKEEYVAPDISGTHDLCCEGGALQLRCKVCPRSPVYWQQPKERPH